ncbi:hypothetical protein GA0115254_121012 [Streptomyces sp. Ncost-T10-10d]|nr:hypothetical protein GA0115254_121012 [Streptomyces sp. Ncost-T10-10d]
MTAGDPMQAPEVPPTKSASRTLAAPSAQALRMAENAGRSGRRRAQVRYSFVERVSLENEVPPLARMLRGGGRGGQVRLKLYLSYLWVQRDDQARELSIRNGAWATLFDLNAPQTAGARRISDAQAWLEENNFISIARTGRQNLVTVLSETGNGDPWIAPGAAAKKEKEEGLLGLGAVVHRYLQIPQTFWTRGHIAVLSGAGIAMFLALLAENGGLQERALWFSPREADTRFALSEDTRSKGLGELAAAGLITTKRRPVNESDFEADALHMRNVHYLHLDRLNETAEIKRRRVIRVTRKKAGASTEES